ncbi:MAG: ATP-binding protein [Bacteroidetes bacterium]|nr:ATP-binding protein [Bacteroidota bacterium]
MSNRVTIVKNQDILFIFIFLFLPKISFAQRKIILTDSLDVYRIGEYTQALYDAGHDFNIDSVASGSESEKFKSLNSNETDFGHTRSAVWIKFTVKNETTKNSRWIVSQGFPVINKVEFYVPSSDNKYKMLEAGTDFPMSTREIKNRKIAFPFQIKPGEQRTFYLRLTSRITLPVYLKISTPAAFTSGEARENLIYGIFYGALLIMALYNIFLFFYIKDSSFLYYSLYAISICYYQTCIDGYAFRYFTPENTWINGHIFIIFVGFASLLWLLFAREFLQISKYSAGFEKLYQAAIIASIIYAAVLAPFSVRTAAIVSFIPIIGDLIVTLVSSVYCLLKGSRNALIFLSAILIFVAGLLLKHLNSLEAVHGSNLGELSPQLGVFGVFLQMTFLSIALGNRINTMKRDEEREKASIRSRIASDLHDEIGSNLSSISLSSQMIKKSPGLGEDEKIQLEDITATAKETADSIRDIIWFIDPEHDKGDDIILKMQNAASKLLHNKNFTFNTNENKIKIAGDLQFRRNLFLIFKEILNNIAKHSLAGNVNINIKNESGALKLNISDDGTGFDITKVRYGYGIKNIKNRVKEMGGILELNSEPGKGTKIEISLKMNRR